MLGVYTILGVAEHGWGSAAHARARRRRRRAARRVRRAPGADRQPADAAAPVPLAQRRGREPRPGAARGRDVRDVLPRRALPAADPRLRRARGRARVPAGDARAWASCRCASRARSALRFGPRATLARRACWRSAPGWCCSRSTPVDGDYVLARPAADGPDRLRRRPRLPVADDAGDVGRDAERLRAGVRASSTRASRSAARSAWPCSPRSRPSARTRCGPTARPPPSALNGGFHLAYLDRRGARGRRARARRRRAPVGRRGARRLPTGRLTSAGGGTRTPTPFGTRT